MDHPTLANIFFNGKEIIYSDTLDKLIGNIIFFTPRHHIYGLEIFNNKLIDELIRTLLNREGVKIKCDINRNVFLKSYIPHIKAERKPFELIIKNFNKTLPFELSKLEETFNISKPFSNYKLKLIEDYSIEENNALKANFNKLPSKLIENVISSYKILKSFNELLKNNFNCHLTDRTTLAGTALNIFKTNYCDSNIIFKTTLEVHNELRPYYYGGRVETFNRKAHNKVYGYDTISLYPFVMNNPMPIGPFNITDVPQNFNINNFFGFIKAKITTPKDIKIGLLPHKQVFKENDYTKETIINLYPEGT